MACITAYAVAGTRSASLRMPLCARQSIGGMHGPPDLRKADTASASLGIASRAHSLNGGGTSGVWSTRSRAPALPRHFRHCRHRIVAKAVAKGWRACHCAPDSQSEVYMAQPDLRKADAASASLGTASRTRLPDGGVTAGMWSTRNPEPALSRRFRHCGLHTDLAAKPVPNRTVSRSHADWQRAGPPTHLAFGESMSRLPSIRKLCEALLCLGARPPC